MQGYTPTCPFWPQKGIDLEINYSYSPTLQSQSSKVSCFSFYNAFQSQNVSLPLNSVRYQENVLSIFIVAP